MFQKQAHQLTVVYWSLQHSSAKNTYKTCLWQAERHKGPILAPNKVTAVSEERISCVSINQPANASLSFTETSAWLEIHLGGFSQEQKKEINKVWPNCVRASWTNRFHWMNRSQQVKELKNKWTPTVSSAWGGRPESLVKSSYFYQPRLAVLWPITVQRDETSLKAFNMAAR